MVKRTLAGRPAHANLVPMERSDNTPYDDDFYAWTQEQAALLRRLPAVSNRLDAELIAEEIEDLGRSEVRSAQSLCEHIIEHLLKLEHSGADEPVRHWRSEVVEWRLQLEKTLTRSIRATLDLPKRYRSALRLLRGQDAPGNLLDRVPPECPYSLKQIISSGGEDWFPQTR
jgi:Domain of unknown function DUF29